MNIESCDGGRQININNYFENDGANAGSNTARFDDLSKTYFCCYNYFGI